MTTIARPIYPPPADVTRETSRQRRWGVVALVAFFAAGMCAGLALAVALIPDQPERIYIPVDQPASPAHPIEGLQA